MSSLPSLASLLATIAEPTRLRILNSLAGAPLFVSDLQTLLDLPQPTVSRHLQALRRAELVRDTPIGQFVLYRLRRDGGAPTRLLGAILESAAADPALRAERELAVARSRTHTRSRMDDSRPSAAAVRARSPR